LIALKFDHKILINYKQITHSNITKKSVYGFRYCRSLYLVSSWYFYSYIRRIQYIL